jgi:hypothetical protein
MTKPDHDHLDDGVDMTFEERRQDTFRRMSGSDEHDADPRVGHGMIVSCTSSSAASTAASSRRP